MSIEHVAEIGSTNAELLSRIDRGEAVKEGHWLVADRQTAGRGRLGRVWRDGAGNYMGSTAIVLCAGDPPPQTLALVLAVAVHAAVSEHMPDAGPDARRLLVKWPNDVLLDGAKLAGILLERAGDYVIAGVGVNLASNPGIASRPAIALRKLGIAVDRDTFALSLARTCAEALANWRHDGIAAIIARWLDLGPPIGTRMRADCAAGESINGTYRGLDQTGGLLLRLEDGRMRAIHAGEVALISAPGKI